MLTFNQLNKEQKLNALNYVYSELIDCIKMGLIMFSKSINPVEIARDSYYDSNGIIIKHLIVQK